MKKFKTTKGWKNIPKIGDVKKIIEDHAESHEMHVQEVAHWLSLKEGGEALAKTEEQLSTFRSKLIKKQAEWRYSQLTEAFLSSENMFSTLPATKSDVDVARVTGVLLNKQFRADIDKVGFINEYVMTAVDEGTVITKVCWESETRTEKVVKEIIERVPVTDEVLAGNMLLMGQEPFQDVVVGHEEVEEEVLVTNKPVLEVCNYKNIVVGKDKKLFIHAWDTTIADLEKTKLYENLDDIQDGDFQSGLFDRIYDEDTYAEDYPANHHINRKQRTVTVIDYWGEWDVGGSLGVIQILFSFIGDTVVRIEENPYPSKKPPFTVAKYRHRKNSEYGGTDAELLEDAQKIQGATMRGVIDLMAKSANAQIGMDESALTPEERDNFMNGKRYTFNGAVNGGRPPYVIHKYPEIPNSALQVVDMMEQEGINLTGNRGFSQTGARGSMGESATMTQVATSSAQQRTQSIIRRLEQGLVDIGRQMVMLNAYFLSYDEVIRVSDEEFVTIAPDDLDGAVDIELNISTIEAEEKRANDKTFMLQTMASILPSDVTMELLASIMESRKEYKLSNKLRDYQPQPNPTQQMVEELRVQLLHAQVQNERALAKENEADIELKRQRARNLGAKADTEELNFVQKMDGSDIARETAKRQKQIQQDLDKIAGEAMIDRASEVNSLLENQ